MTGDRPPTSDIDRRLRREPVAWLQATRPDGSAALLPTWFSWDGALMWVFAPPGEAWVRAMRSDPRVVLTLGDPDDRSVAVQLIEGEATLLATPTARSLTAVHRAKYGDQVAERDTGWESYAAEHPQAIVIRPTRYLPRPGTPGAESDAQPPSARPLAAVTPG